MHNPWGSNPPTRKLPVRTRRVNGAQSPVRSFPRFSPAQEVLKLSMRPPARRPDCAQVTFRGSAVLCTGWASHAHG